MSRMNRIGSHKTCVFTDESGYTSVVYHSTAVVKFNPVTRKIILNSGGYLSVTTKARMNQTSHQFNLGFSVSQKDFEWFVAINEKTIPFSNNMVIDY